MSKLITAPYLLAILIAAAGVVGCSSEDATEPVRQPLQYRLFPAGYFSTGHREDYAITGSSPAGLVLEGTHIEVTGQVKEFNGETVVTLLQENDWVDTQTSDAFTTAELQHYTLETAQRRLMGIEDLVNPSVATSLDPKSLPVTAGIGDSGVIGSYLDNLGRIIEKTWRVEAAGNDMARVIFETVVIENGRQVTAEGSIGYVIDTAGNRQEISIVFDVKALNDPVTWTGAKQ